MAAPEYLELPAPPPLDALIHCFWFLRGRLGGAPAQPVLPDGRMEIVLHLAEPFAEVDAAGVARGQAPALLAGQLTRPFHLLPQGDSVVIGIRFRTTGARSWLRMPAAEVTGRVVALREVDSRLADALMSAAQRRNDGKAEGNDAATVERLCRELDGSIRREPVPLVAAAVEALGDAHPLPVGAVAARLGVTPRTLERRVLEETGLSPKMLQRVIRFRRALRLLERTPRGGWSRAAVRAGYFDQAHLLHDFSRFAGMPPSAYFQTDAPLSRAISGQP